MNSIRWDCLKAPCECDKRGQGRQGESWETRRDADEAKRRPDSFSSRALAQSPWANRSHGRESTLPINASWTWGAMEQRARMRRLDRVGRWMRCGAVVRMECESGLMERLRRAMKIGIQRGEGLTGPASVWPGLPGTWRAVPHPPNPPPNVGRVGRVGSVGRTQTKPQGASLPCARPGRGSTPTNDRPLLFLGLSRML